MSLPTILESGTDVPGTVIGYVSVRSQGGTSLFEADEVTDTEPFYGSDSDHGEARRAIEAAGVEVLAESRLGLAVAGPPEAFAELTGGQIVPRERLMHTRAWST